MSYRHKQENFSKLLVATLREKQNSETIESLMDGYCKSVECRCKEEGVCSNGWARLVDCPDFGLMEAAHSVGAEDFNDNVEDNDEALAALLSGMSIPWNKLDEFAGSTPKTIVTIVGASNSGKTTFLGFFFLLLLNGYRLPSWRFQFSLTLKAWEAIVRFKRYEIGVNGPSDPLRTVATGQTQFLHITFRNQTSGRIHSLFLPDPPGELFSRWALDRDDSFVSQIAEISEKSKAFLVLIDCARLFGGEKHAFAQEIEHLLIRIRGSQDDPKFPLAVVWAKYDLKPTKEAEMEGMRNVISNFFPTYEEFYVSRSSLTGESVPHSEAIRALEWILNNI